MGDNENKVYIGGLSPETTKETFESHFAQYGDIVDCIVMIDKATHRSRGFGFVTFKESSAANAALGTANFLDGREVSCKKAVRDTPKPLVQDASGVYNSVKIFVGGLPSTCDYEKLTGYFSRFGQIQDAVVMMDPQTQRHRGFGYVTFADSSAVEAAIQMYPDNKIDGKWIEVKRSIPQEMMRDKGGGGKGFDGGKGKGNYAQMAPAPRAYGSPYGDPYAAWYAGAVPGSADPYAAYAAYGMYPQMGGNPYYGGYGGAVPTAYQQPHPHYGASAYGPPASRYSGYRSAPY